MCVCVCVGGWVGGCVCVVRVCVCLCVVCARLCLGVEVDEEAVGPSSVHRRAQGGILMLYYKNIE